MPDPSLYEGYQDEAPKAQNYQDVQYSQPRAAGGQPQAAPGQAQTARAAQQPAKKPKVWLIVLIIVLAVIAIFITLVVLFVRSAVKQYEKYESKLEYQFDDSDMPKVPDASDIDIDELNKAVEDMKNLDLTGEIEKAQEEVQEEVEDITSDPGGEFTKYSYADVVTNGTDITITPNGGLNASTKLFDGNDKDLDGFLDYIDSKVLEEGRTINRDLFYDVLATMLVDSKLNAGKENIESNMFMALAFANNFHAIKVEIDDCELDANNASEYRYHVNAEGRDDIWLVDFGKKTVFFANGATEYHSDMFKDEYLAVWFTAIEDYYGF